MAILTLFAQTKAKLDVLELDASISEVHERTAELTRSPVEDGSSISDNVVLMPKKLTMEGIISKTPLGVAGLVGSAITAIAAAAGQTAAAKNASNAKLAKTAATIGVASLGGLIASAIGGSRDPVDVFSFLEGLWQQRQPFDVITALTGKPSTAALAGPPGIGGFAPMKKSGYFNMIITNLNTPRNKDNVNALRFTATLEQVITVSTSVATLSQVPGAGATQNLGKQSTGGASSGVTASADSYLVQFGAPGG